MCVVLDQVAVDGKLGGLGVASHTGTTRTRERLEVEHALHRIRLGTRRGNPRAMVQHSGGSNCTGSRVLEVARAQQLEPPSAA